MAKRKNYSTHSDKLDELLRPVFKNRDKEEKSTSESSKKASTGLFNNRDQKKTTGFFNSRDEDEGTGFFSSRYKNKETGSYGRNDQKEATGLFRNTSSTLPSTNKEENWAAYAKTSAANAAGVRPNGTQRVSSGIGLQGVNNKAGVSGTKTESSKPEARTTPSGVLSARPESMQTRQGLSNPYQALGTRSAGIANTGINTNPLTQGRTDIKGQAAGAQNNRGMDYASMLMGMYKGYGQRNNVQASMNREPISNTAGAATRNNAGQDLQAANQVLGAGTNQQKNDYIDMLVNGKTGASTGIKGGAVGGGSARGFNYSQNHLSQAAANAKEPENAQQVMATAQNAVNTSVKSGNRTEGKGLNIQMPTVGAGLNDEGRQKLAEQQQQSNEKLLAKQQAAEKLAGMGKPSISEMLRTKEAKGLGVPEELLDLARSNAGDKIAANNWKEKFDNAQRGTQEFNNLYLEGVRLGQIRTNTDGLVAMKDRDIDSGILQLEQEIKNHTNRMQNKHPDRPQEPFAPNAMNLSVFDLQKAREQFNEEKTRYQKDLSNWEGMYGESRLEELQNLLDDYKAEKQRREELKSLQAGGVTGRFQYGSVPVLNEARDGRELAKMIKDDAEYVYLLTNGQTNAIRDLDSRFGEAFLLPDQAKQEINLYYNAAAKAEDEATKQALRQKALDTFYKWEPLLQEMRTEERIYREQKVAQGEYGWLSGVPTVLAQPLIGLNETALAVGAFLHVGDAGNIHSTAHAWGVRSNATRQELARLTGEEFANKWGEDARKWGVFASNTAFSLADNYMAMGFGKLFTGGAVAAEKQAARVVQFIMSSEATASTLVNQTLKGRNAQDAAALAIAGGLVEWVTEKWSVERYMNPGRFSDFASKADFVQFITRSMLTEGTEEVAADVLNTMVDQIASRIWDRKSELEEAYDEAYDRFIALDYSEEDAEREATKYVAYDYVVNQLGMSFLGGAFSALPLSATTAAGAKINYTMVGSNVMNQENAEARLREMIEENKQNSRGKNAQRLAARIESDLNSGNKQNLARVGSFTLMMNGQSNAQASMSTGEIIQDRDNVQDLLKAARMMPEGSKALERVKALDARAESGKGISTHQLTKLAKDIMSEGTAQIRDVTQGIYTDEMTNYLTSHGVSQTQAKELGAILAKANLQGAESLTASEEETLVNNRIAFRAYEESVKGKTEWDTQIENALNEARQRSIKETAAVRQAVTGTVNMAAGYRAGMNMTDAIVSTARKNAMTATQEEIQHAEGEKTGALNEVIFNNEAARIVGINNQGVVVENSEGKSETVQLADIKATNQEVGALLQVARNNPKMLGTKYLNEALKAATKLGTEAINQRFAEDVVAIDMAAKLGKAAPWVSLDSETTNQLYNAAQEETQERDAEIAAKAKEIIRKTKPGQGTLKLEGAEYGTTEFNEKVKNLPVAQRKSVDILAAYIRQSGATNIELVNDPENTSEYGQYDEKTGKIYLNIAGMDSGNQSHSILNAVAHEWTHWMQAISTKSYNNLKTTVLNMLEGSGTNLERLVTAKINDYSHYAERLGDSAHLSIEAAIDEIIADSSDQIFASEEFRNRLQQKDEKAYGAVRQFVRKMVSNMRAAIGIVRQSASAESRRLQGQLEKISKVWLDSYEQAVSGEAVQSAIREYQNVTPEQLNQQREQSGELTPMATKHSMAGMKAQGVFGEDVARAYQMAKEGYDADTILEETGCIPGYKGKDGTQMWWRVIDSDKFEIQKYRFQSNDWFRQEDILKADELYEAYPELRNKIISFTTNLENDVFATTDGEENIWINLNMLDGLSKYEIIDIVRDTILHEDHHFIQTIENSYRGTSVEEMEVNAKVGRQNIANANNTIESIAEKYGVEPNLLKWAEFTQDGEIDENSIDAGTYAKVANMDAMDLYTLKSAADTLEKWNTIVSHTAKQNYERTVGEREAVAAERRGSEQYSPINYENAIAAEDYSQEQAEAASQSQKNTANQESVRFSLGDSNVKEAAKGELLSAEEKKTDIRYALADKQTRNYLRSWAENHVMTMQDKAEKILNKYGISTDILKGNKLAEGTWDQYRVSKRDQNTLNTLLKDIDKWTNNAVDAMGLDENDLGAQYVKAWREFDFDKMDQILLQKLDEMENIIGIRSPQKNLYQNKTAEYARLLKEGNPEAVARAAFEMSQLVPKNAVLIPMPDHNGNVNDNTDTMILAQKISELTGRPVVKALTGEARQSRRVAKLLNQQLTAEDLKMKQAAEIPEGTVPIFIDNVVASGVTAKAAHDAIGRGITLAYAYTPFGEKGVKLAQNTFLDSKQQFLIPLDAKFDTAKQDRRYSLESAENRKARITEANENIRSIIQKIGTNEKLTADQVINIIGKENMTSAFEQWLHNTYEKGNDRYVSKAAIERYLDADNDKISKGTKSLYDNWEGMIKSNTEIYEKTIDNPKAPKGYKPMKKADIAHALFGSDRYIDIGNKDTDTTIRIDNDTIGKTIDWNLKADIPTYVTEQVLLNSPELLKNAIYLGSHINYAHTNGNVHYYVSNVKFGKMRDSVVFAVHDATEKTQTYSERAYVAEIMLIEKKASSTLDSLITEDEHKYQELRQLSPSENSIEEALQNVNTDRMRFFDKDALKGKTVSFSLRNINAPIDKGYLEAINKGDMKHAQWYVDDAAAELGYTIHAYHGTGRADRVGNVFRADRATSGPMAFFTDSKEIAEGYARDKQDTSIAYDEEYGDYFTQFRAKDKNGKSIRVGDLWNSMSYQEKNRVKEAAKHITWDENVENIIYDKNAKTGNGGFNDWTLRDHKGNAIDALAEAWLNSGDLYDREEMFLDVLKLAGIKDVTWNNPEAREEKVYDTYLKIQNPFVVNDSFTDEFVDGLLEWWEQQDQSKYEKENLGSDLWDKNQWKIEDWADRAREEIKNGTTHVWTSIPDAVTDYLKSQGYDGIEDEGGKGGGMGHTVYIPFSSEQIKSAETITYDDEGNVIPPSERFNSETQDIRYSIQDRRPDMDVNAWMESLQPWQLRTESERQLLADYKGLRTKIGLQNMRISNTKNEISKLQAKEQLTAEEKKQLENLKIKLQNAQTVRDQLEEKLIQVTSEEGYANIMMRENRFISDYLEGRTHEQVQETVKRLQDAAEDLMGRISRTAEELKGVAESAGVKRVRAMMNQNNLDKAAADIRKQYGSSINKQELMNQIAKIRLEMAQGNSDMMMEDIESLAGQVIENAGTRNEQLAMLRGTTITLAPGQAKELLGSNRTIKDVRDIFAGTGIKIRQATAEQIRNGQRLGLDSKWDELCDVVQSLNRDTPAEEQIFQLMEFVKGAKESQRQSATKNYDLADVMNDILNKVMDVGLTKAQDPAVQQELRQMHDIIQQMQNSTAAGGEMIEQMRSMLANVVKAGREAATWTDALKRDVASTVEYFEKTAKMAQETARNEKLRETIARLKSEAAEKLLKSNQEWRDLIERDRKTRIQMEDNDATRGKMNTVVNRLYNLLAGETDQKNIPEEYKGLARELIQMFSDNDVTGRKLLRMNGKQRARMRELLTRWTAQDGGFDISEFTGPNATEGMRDVGWVIQDDLETIRETMEEWNGAYKGKNHLDTAQQMGKTLEKMQEAVSEIYSIIQSARNIDINGRKFQTEELAFRFMGSASQSNFKGERNNKLAAGAHKFVVTGNMTPEYFIKGLKNEAMDIIWDEFKRSENRNGLEIDNSRKFMEETAKKYHYDQWDLKKRKKIETLNGPVNMTVEQMMALYATWKREQTIGPNMSQHLERGGFYLNEGNQGKFGRTKDQLKAHRMNGTLMLQIDDALTQEQKDYVDEVVRYMSEDMSKLGNEASMRMYGIKKYKESYYFPFRRWGGVANFSSDSGSMVQNQENRAAHKGWTKRRINTAANALEIGNFTDIATAHIVEMINYNTMAVAIENMNKMLNYQTEEGYEDNITKRNMRMVMRESYGSEALDYLETLMKDMNGGVMQDPRGGFVDKLLSTFRKGAVAGSLSVAAQQPLSYIRAANEINPIYLARALSPDTWKGSYAEMMKYSGVAVIKEMGRFDMNFGASAKEYIRPEGAKSAGQKIGNAITTATTALPNLMDRITWTRMWSAVKAEQKHLNPDMDTKSDEFMEKVAERFNDVMRRTQVYDSVLVKSSNMRSKNYGLKTLTSFMAEPTLSLNVLEDAARNINQKGGKRKAAMAGATFLLSAIAQAAVKGFFGAGRNPDDDKTREENFLYRMGASLLSEVNPLGLIPGYSDLVEVLSKGELTNDAMTPIGKLYSIIETIRKADSSNLGYRFWEDTAGQITQVFTEVPAKNIMRDIRAMINFFDGGGDLTNMVGGKQYADRESSMGVIKNQMLDTLHSQDLIGLINGWLGEAGYKTSNQAYLDRLYEAKQSGDAETEQQLTDYLLNGKGVKESTITKEMNKRIKEDESLNASDQVDQLLENGARPTDYIKTMYAEERMTREEAEAQYRKTNPTATDKDVAKVFDKIDYEAETGQDLDNYSPYKPLYDAIDSGNNKEAMTESAKLLKLGYQEKDIKSQIKKHIVNGFKDGSASKQETEKKLTSMTDMDKDDIFWTLDRIEYEQQSGKDIAGNAKYYRLWDAMDSNTALDIGGAIKMMTEHGTDKSDIKGEITKKYRTAYLDADSAGKRKIRDAIQKAYKLMGYTAEDADKIINKWKAK